MIRELGFPEDRAVPVVLSGSVFVRGESPLLIDMFREKVKAANPGKRVDYTLLMAPPVAGAVIWALRSLRVPEGALEKVCPQLSIP